MKLSRSRPVIGMMTLIVSVGAGLVVSLGGGSQPAARAASSGGVWIQTMDSCKNALGGAAYEVVGTGISVTTPAANPSTVTQTPTCPLEHGDCVNVTKGCTSFAGLAPGTYTIRETVTPPANATNPGGYAPCEGGSACRWQKAVLTVGSGGGAQATVTNVYPDGTTTNFTFAGTASDPIVFHDFGIGSGSCDGDGDADDHLTGTPSSECNYPENLEATACQPFPWSCTVGNDNAVFIHQAYETMVGHDVDPASLSYWLGQLDAGTSRQALAMALATSPDYRTSVIGGNLASGVKDFYELYLHRTATSAEIAYWVGRMAGVGGPRLTFEQVRLQFIGSWEFFNVTNHADPSAMITALYTEVLGRTQAPAQSELSYWLSHFNVNTIASQFLYSPEGRQYLVGGYYSSILGRPADAPGLAYWTQQLLNGASDENIIASIQSSGEYFLKKASLN
jgi:Domain of unknown function (DUF4214)